MKLQRFDSPSAFYQQAETFLVEREAEHVLMLGICNELINGVSHGTEPTYTVCVYDGNKIIAAGLRTPPHHITLSNLAPPEALQLIAQDMYRVDEGLTGVHGDSTTSETFAHIWQTLTGRTPVLTMRQGLFKLDTVKSVTGVPGRMRRANIDDTELLVEWYISFEKEAFATDSVDEEHIRHVIDDRLKVEARSLFIWEDGEPVSLAGTAGPTPHGIRIGPVYTPLHLRRKGYASALVATLSQQMLDNGRSFCSLFTDLSNPTSNHVYQNVGYNAVNEVSLYRFD